MCIETRSGRQRGLTLVELIMFIVIVGAGVVGILAVMNQVVRSSADPMIAKQAVAFADAVLEEVLAKAYADPDGAPNQEANRSLWDDVTDYDGETIQGTALLTGADTALLNGYSAVVAVADVTVSGTAMRRVTVTATAPGGGSYAVGGYRANY